ERARRSTGHYGAHTRGSDRAHASGPRACARVLASRAMRFARSAGRSFRFTFVARVLVMAALASACGSDERAPTPSVAPSLPEPTREEAPVTGAGAAGAGGALGEDVPPEDTPLVPAPELEPEVLTPNASGYVWRPVVMGGGGFVSGIVTSRAQPGLVFARTDVGGA